MYRPELNRVLEARSSLALIDIRGTVTMAWGGVEVERTLVSRRQLGVTDFRNPCPEAMRRLEPELLEGLIGSRETRTWVHINPVEIARWVEKRRRAVGVPRGDR